jgi:hypothetical protein
MSGLEVIGSIASVVQLAGAVYSISIQLYEVANALSNAPADIKDLAHDLEIFSEELLLHSKLVNANNSRYSDQINRLTAKIIGRCATICEKIDKILKKLRSGSVLARLKWMYKEKEIRKLLGRLRDLKLSLMGTLSLLRMLKADHMMDALGVQAPSLLDGPQDENLSRETMEEVENTRRKLESITMDKCKPPSLCGTTLTPQSSWNSREMDETSGEPEQQREGDFQTVWSMSVQSGAVSRTVEQASTIPLMSALALPGINTIMQNPDALESVQSFHSAVSNQENPFENAQDATWGLQSDESRAIPSNYLTGAGPSATSATMGAPHSIHGATVPVLVWPLHDASSKPYAGNRDTYEGDFTLNSDSYRSWQKDVAEATASHFNVAPKDAESFACSIQIPRIKNVPVASVDLVQPDRNQIRYQVEPRRASGQYTSQQIPTPFVVIREGGVWQSGNQGLDRFRTSTMQSSYDSKSPLTNHFPMSIPNSRDPVPSPLPPPRHLADIADGGSNGPDIAWLRGNSHVDNSDLGQPIASAAPGSSLYGSFFKKGKPMHAHLLGQQLQSDRWDEEWVQKQNDQRSGRWSSQESELPLSGMSNLRFDEFELHGGDTKSDRRSELVPIKRTGKAIVERDVGEEAENDEQIGSQVARPKRPTSEKEAAPKSVPESAIDNQNSTSVECASSLRPPSSRAIGSGHHLPASADMAAFSNEPSSSRIRPSSGFYGTQRGQAQGGSARFQEWLEPVKCQFVESQSAFTSVDESRSGVSQHDQPPVSSPIHSEGHRLKKRRGRSVPLAVNYNVMGYTPSSPIEYPGTDKSAALEVPISEEGSDGVRKMNPKANHSNHQLRPREEYSTNAFTNMRRPLPVHHHNQPVIDEANHYDSFYHKQHGSMFQQPQSPRFHDQARPQSFVRSPPCSGPQKNLFTGWQGGNMVSNGPISPDYYMTSPIPRKKGSYFTLPITQPSMLPPLPVDSHFDGLSGRPYQNTFTDWQGGNGTSEIKRNDSGGTLEEPSGRGGTGAAKRMKADSPGFEQTEIRITR